MEVYEPRSSRNPGICSPIEYDKQACNIVLSKIIKIIKILGIEKIEMLIPFFLAKLHFPNATLL